MKRKIEILTSSHAGYCFGVKRAMRLIEQGLASVGEPIYTLGDVIHNPPEVERLRARGVRSVASLEEVAAGGTLVLRAHGVHPDLIQEARRRGILILDATCPFVQRSQSFVKQYSEESLLVIIIGDRDHPEVQGIAGHAGKGVIIVRDEVEAASVVPIDKAGVVIQTTFARGDADKVIKVLSGRVRDLRVRDTICQATEARRAATLALAKKVDLMIVVGGRNSSNTKSLFQVCIDAHVPTHLIESADEIDSAWFERVRRIGLTTGTSTPDWLIDAVLARIAGVADGLSS
ncbi:MAG: 4-hydroxy-3-methylbut-2-enyl diphosphate reductase [Candidatus Krumholzibacteria bacterium]|nr:4-hydroxy-3-methylbut-2-enyl diphosphate reductase [Candidatus Krumholzibacteria bacterium]